MPMSNSGCPAWQEFVPVDFVAGLCGVLCCIPEEAQVEANNKNNNLHDEVVEGLARAINGVGEVARDASLGVALGHGLH